MSIKTKVASGVAFLFFVILVISGIAWYYVRELSEDSRDILKDNYETLVYTKRIIEGSDSLSIDPARAQRIIERNLQLQEQNTTEPGEDKLTRSLRLAFEKLKENNDQSNIVIEIRKIALDLQELNMQAIFAKYNVTQKTGERATLYVIIIVTIMALAAFTFIVNFPGYVADPIVKLTKSIKSIANKNYEERLHFDRKDEFEELAEAFNLMAEKLDEFEHSNLAKVLFEKKRIETIINRMSDPLVGLDENRRVVFANDQALELLNLPSNAIIGRYAPDIAVDNDLFRHLIKDEGNHNEDEDHILKIVVNGRENYFSKESIAIRYTPTGENAPIAIGQLILLKNITPYKELDLAKTNFIAVISHELKTPIASLKMCSKLLQDNRVGKLNKEQLDLVSTIEEETTRLSKITNELLDLAQVETGNIKLKVVKVDPKEIIQLAVEAVKFQAERKHVTIAVKLPEQVPDMWGDLEKTTWVLINLLTNAVRYTPENGTILLSCNAQNHVLNISVKDFGPGIEEKYLSRLFDKFFQIPGSPSGTGLGLAISKEFIEAQNGKITVESEIGKGSTFYLEMPRAS